MAEDYSVSMTSVRAGIVALRLQGLTLAALIERRILEPEEAAALVREAATFLSAPTNSPVIEKMHADNLEQIAQQLERHRRR